MQARAILDQGVAMVIRQNIQIALVVVTMLWLVHVLNLFLPIDLRLYGVRPRSIDGLWGILATPFLHGGFGHLLANTGALAILLAVSLSFSRKLTILALLIIVVGGGGLVWLFGTSNTVHIGASGIVFGLIGFLMFIGVFRRQWKALIFSLAVFFCYGGALLSFFRLEPGISWTGHFFGFGSGVLAASLTKRERLVTRKVIK
jgi:membrane associated rhomboid family serine protease